MIRLFNNYTSSKVIACAGSNIFSKQLANSTKFFAAPSFAAAVRHHGNHGDTTKPLRVKVELASGEVKEIVVHEGQSLIDMASEHGLPVEAACAGSIACSTCHCYLENEEAMAKFDPPSDAEYDMLDMAYMPGPMSRLGCQLKVKQGVHDGIKFRLPKATRNMAVDGYKPSAHH